MNNRRFLEYILVLFDIPEKIRRRLKRKIILTYFEKVGSNFIFDPQNSIIPEEGKKKVGNNVFIGDNAYLGGDFSIGNNVMFGPNVTLLGGNHLFAILGKSPRFLRPVPGSNPEPITIEDETWIGANAVILGNVTIGIGSVIGAGSVVNDNVCPFTVYVGNPSRPKRIIFDDSNLLKHLQDIGYDVNKANEIIQRRKRELKDSELPIINKTDQVRSYLYNPF